MASSSRRPWVIVAVVTGVLVAMIVLFVPPPANAERRAKGQLTEFLNNARQLQIATQARWLDRSTARGDEAPGLPFDVGAKTARDYFEPLVRENYLSPADYEKLLVGLTVTNASRHDPPGTALIVSESLDAGGDPGERGFVALALDGSGGVFARADHRVRVTLPPREPAILPPR